MGTLPSLLIMASLSTQLTHWIKKPWARKASGLFIICLGIAALWMPINSMINTNLHGHNNSSQYIIKSKDHMDTPMPNMHKPKSINTFKKSTDLDYLT